MDKESSYKVCEIVLHFTLEEKNYKHEVYLSQVIEYKGKKIRAEVRLWYHTYLSAMKRKKRE